MSNTTYTQNHKPMKISRIKRYTSNKQFIAKTLNLHIPFIYL